MDGSEGPSAAEARKVGDAVAAALGIPVEYWDERLTTVAAGRMLVEAHVSRARRKQVVDQVAAALILQGWLDARRPQPTGDEG
jgi:putative Holliday junction resolvase